MLLLLGLAFTVAALSAGGGVARRAARAPTQVKGRGSAHARSGRTPHGALAAAEAKGNNTIRRLAQLGLPVYCAGPHGNAVAFTFDDGPGPYTHFAIKKLTQSGERATFFVVGRSMDDFPTYLSTELGVAAIGDHTYTHPVLPQFSPAAITSEIERTKQKIEAASGRSVDLFRPPYGSRDATVDQIARQLGLLEIIWTVDSADSLGANYAGIIRNVEAGLHPGAIILMHENRGQTIRALTTILPEMRRRHIRSVSLPQLFASDPPSAAQLRLGPAGCRATTHTSRSTKPS